MSTDIFTQAITIKLRNYRVNKIRKTLSIALKTVPNVNIIPKTNDMHNPVYKYIENHFNKKLFLHNDLFSDLNAMVTTTNFKKIILLVIYVIVTNHLIKTLI